MLHHWRKSGQKLRQEPGKGIKAEAWGKLLPGLLLTACFKIHISHTHENFTLQTFTVYPEVFSQLKFFFPVNSSLCYANNNNNNKLKDKSMFVSLSLCICLFVCFILLISALTDISSCLLFWVVQCSSFSKAFVSIIKLVMWDRSSFLM